MGLARTGLAVGHHSAVKAFQYSLDDGLGSEVKNLLLCAGMKDPIEIENVALVDDDALIIGNLYVAAFLPRNDWPEPANHLYICCHERNSN